jgi:hypothetical protein
VYALPIVAKLSKRQDVNDLIQKNRDQEYDKDVVRITRLVPQEIRQISAKTYHIASIIKDITPSTNVKVKDGKISVNGQPYKAPLTPPTLSEILQVPDDKVPVLNNINFYGYHAYREKGSTFRAFATPIKTINDARLAYRAMS